MSLPATRVAVQQLDPWFVAFGRAVGAAALAAAYLWLSRAPRPTREQARRLAIVALGVVAGFPLFTSLALTSQTAAHGAVVIALLPAMTAVLAVLRAGSGRRRCSGRRAVAACSRCWPSWWSAGPCTVRSR